jgi:hypothetical protein
MSLLPVPGRAGVVVWTLEPEGSPAVVRRCPRCDVARPFTSTRRFRVNSNGRRLDVWLVYGCARCGSTWNLTVARRVSPAELGDDLVRFERNDARLARSVASDPALLAAAGVRPEPVGWRLREGPVERPCVIRIDCAWPSPPRLDRVLADGLGRSRSSIARMHRDGAIALLPGDDPRLLRRPVRPGQQVRVV